MQFVNTIINYIYRWQKNCELSKEHNKNTNKYYTRQQQQFFAFKTTTKKIVKIYKNQVLRKEEKQKWKMEKKNETLITDLQLSNPNRREKLVLQT